jgi:hypothetical protein
MYTAKSPFIDGYWLGVKDGDPRVLALYNRHYSAYQYADGRQRKLCAGPGQKCVLLSYQADALFIWRKFKSMDHQEGVNCAVFRNESPIRSSEMILEAMDIAAQRWHGERLYTYVDGSKVTSRNPGYCFKVCGWQVCGLTKVNKLIILEYVPPFVIPVAA